MEPQKLAASILFAHSVSDSFATPWTVALGAPLSKEFPRGEYWSGLPFPLPGHLPDTGIEPQFPGLQEGALPMNHQESPYSVSLVQSLTRVQLFATPRARAHQASLSITNSRSLFKLMSIRSMMPSNHLVLCRPLLLLSQSLPASGSFPVSQFFASGGQRTGAPASAGGLPMNIQD